MPKKLKLMEELKEKDNENTEEKDKKNDDADLYQHITEDIKE